MYAKAKLTGPMWLKPINRTAVTVTTGYVENVTKRTNRVEELARVLGIAYELAARVLTNKIDRFELEFLEEKIRDTISRPARKQTKKVYILNVIDRAINECPALMRRIRVPREQLERKKGWKETRICPECKKKCLSANFVFCPMCGCHLH